MGVKAVGEPGAVGWRVQGSKRDKIGRRCERGHRVDGDTLFSGWGYL